MPKNSAFRGAAGARKAVNAENWAFRGVASAREATNAEKFGIQRC